MSRKNTRKRDIYRERKRKEGWSEKQILAWEAERLRKAKNLDRWAGNAIKFIGKLGLSVLVQKVTTPAPKEVKLTPSDYGRGLRNSRRA